METAHPTTDQTQPTTTPASQPDFATLESREARNTRISTGILIGIFGLLLFAAGFGTRGDARFRLVDVDATAQLPIITLPGMATVFICALICLAASDVFVLMNRPRLRRWMGVAAALALAVGFITWAIAGKNTEFLMTNQLKGTLLFATPIALGALGGVLSERSGVVNIAIEGQMLTAALTGSMVASGTNSLIYGVLAGVAAALLLSALLALFSITYLVDQVVLGVILNMFAAGLTGFIFDNVLKANQHLNQPPAMPLWRIPGLSKIPFVGPILFAQLPIVHIAVASVILVWFLLYRTAWGLRVRAVGEHPLAADTVGINVLRIRWSAILIGGIFAGLGGVYFTLGYNSGFSNKNITVGYGFIALAAVIMGRWHPVWSALMALFFGFVSQLALQMGNFSTGIPASMLNAVPHMATIIAVAGLIGRVRGPAADGTPYTKN